jgi:metallo-beta-lactamase family protein
LLVKRGFRGEVICTPATRELARIVLTDAAHLQEEEAERGYLRSRHGRHGSTPQPLYTVRDVELALERFGRPLAYGRELDLAQGLSVTAYNAGHILGSASLRFGLDEDGTQRSVAFSGDLGTGGRELLDGPVPPPQADVVVMETTYGDRLHRPLAATLEEFYGAINETLRRGGNVVIPTFALERAQEILFYLRAGVLGDQLPGSLAVFLDSPMAVVATDAFRHHPDAAGSHVRELLTAGTDPFSLPGLHISRDVDASRAINRIRSGAVIMAGAGMCTGGRVMHHLEHNLAREESSVIFVGYAAAGTPARNIIDGARSLRLYGEDVPVRAAVYTINGFSAHADRDQLLAWRSAVAPARTFLVHGDRAVTEAFAERLPGAAVTVPALSSTYPL